MRRKAKCRQPQRLPPNQAAPRQMACPIPIHPRVQRLPRQRASSSRIGANIRASLLPIPAPRKMEKTPRSACRMVTTTVQGNQAGERPPHCVRGELAPNNANLPYTASAKSSRSSRQRQHIIASTMRLTSQFLLSIKTTINASNTKPDATRPGGKTICWDCDATFAARLQKITTAAAKIVSRLLHALHSRVQRCSLPCLTTTRLSRIAATSQSAEEAPRAAVAEPPPSKQRQKPQQGCHRRSDQTNSLHRPRRAKKLRIGSTVNVFWSSIVHTVRFLASARDSTSAKQYKLPHPASLTLAPPSCSASPGTSLHPRAVPAPSSSLSTDGPASHTRHSGSADTSSPRAGCAARHRFQSRCSQFDAHHAELARYHKFIAAKSALHICLAKTSHHDFAGLRQVRRTHVVAEIVINLLQAHPDR